MHMSRSWYQTKFLDAKTQNTTCHQGSYKTRAWARPAGISGGLGHRGERLQRPAGAGGLRRVWGEPPAQPFLPNCVSGGGHAVVRADAEASRASFFRRGCVADTRC